jgi:DNA-binding transcriptional LysR family regulator
MLEPARRMADAARDVSLIASGADAKLRGAVRVTAPPGIAYDLLAPFAVELKKHLPEVRLEVISTVGYLDLARREADLAVRFESSARPAVAHGLQVLARFEQGVAAYATREYAATLPRSYGVRDVAWIGWAPPLDQVPPNPQLAALIPDFRPVFASDDFLVQYRAAEAGVGAILLGRIRSHRGLPSPLIQLALDLGKRVSALQLICASNALAIPRVRAVAQLLTKELQTMSAPSRSQPRKRG